MFTFIYNCIVFFTGKLNSTVRDLVFRLCCLTLMTIYVFFHVPVIMIPGRIMIIGTVITIVMAVASAKRSASQVKWNKYTFLPMVLFGIGMFLIGLVHSVGDGFVVFPLDLIFIFPFFYYVWINRGDHETMYIAISTSILILGIISFVYCFFLAERGGLITEGERVAGHMGNSNFLGCIGAVLFISSLFLLSIISDRLGYLAICSVGLGIGIVYVALSGSRTAMLSQISSLIVAIVFMAKMKEKITMTSKDVCIRMMIVLAAVIIVTYAGMKLDDINYRANSQAEVTSGETIKIVQTAYAEDEPADATQPGEGVIPLLDRVSPPGESADLNSFGSGRIVIWKIYADNLSWFGRPHWEIEDQLSDATETRAHNNILEYFYRCGYIVGSIYVLFYIAVGIAALKRCFGKKYNDSVNMMLVMIVFTYMIYSLVEIAFLPFTRIVPCLFFLMIAPLMGEKEIID